MNDAPSLIIKAKDHILLTLLLDSIDLHEHTNRFRSNGFFILYSGIKDNVDQFKEYFYYEKSKMFYNLYDSYLLTELNKQYSKTHDFNESINSIDNIFKIKSKFIIISKLK